MPIQELEKRILDEAQAEAEEIKSLARQETQKRNQVQASKIQDLKNQVQTENQRKAEEIKRLHLVPARLHAKKALLEAKQDVLTRLYAEIQKEHNLSAAETKRLREESEVKVTQILFGE